MSAETGAGGGAHVQIGSISGGSQAFGDHGRADSTNVTSVPGQGYERLLGAVRTLRGELDGAEGHTPEDEELDAELVAVEREIGRTGSSGPLTRLRTLLERYGAATATAASVTAVLQAIAQIPG
ncbi:hypothetical protein [Streptomyces sp. A1499]|uniref:hypothetical protein n=1 Tax=Streptomyces sp. A1499 TaxID=2563104 RepID=UPI00109E5624|nr:hypothetical protein [Streptomyces sp. A1499]THC53176.1 hypothetical protein E7X58_07925 [Streptomyces sp. A1499]